MHRFRLECHYQAMRLIVLTVLFHWLGGRYTVDHQSCFNSRATMGALVMKEVVTRRFRLGFGIVADYSGVANSPSGYYSKACCFKVDGTLAGWPCWVAVLPAACGEAPVVHCVEAEGVVALRVPLSEGGISYGARR